MADKSWLDQYKPVEPSQPESGSDWLSQYKPVDESEDANKEEPYANDSAWDLSGERTILGRLSEANKAVPRGFLSTALTALEGSEAMSKYMPGAMIGDYLGKKALGLFGVDESEIEAKREEQRQYIPKLQQYIQEESVLAADEKYRDLWTTQFGEGAGSFGAFGLASVINPGLGVATGVASGAGTQAQKVRAAREAGVDVSGAEEYGATVLGSAIGALEAYTPFKLVKALKSVPKDIPLSAKQQLFSLVKQVFNPSVIKTGAGEGGQEVVSSILQQIVEMGYNPEAELPTAESLWNDFSIGALTGAGAEVLTDVVKARRLNTISQVDSEREREFRQTEDANNFLMGKMMRDNEQARILAETDPVEFSRQAEAARTKAVEIAPPPLEQVAQFTAPSYGKKEPTPAAVGELYSMRIIGALGQYFPTDTTFSVEQNENGFTVKDASGIQYGQPLQDQRSAVSLAANLNKEVGNKGIRGAILETLMNAPEGYSQQDADSLFRYGFRALSPEANRVSFAALNEAADTTTEKGYAEDLPLDIVAGAKKLRDGRYSVQMPDGSTRYIAGLTASQKLNLERTKQGLPPATTFDIKEARQFLGNKIGALAEPTISGIQDNAEYGGTVIDGKPVVASSAGEVLPGRIVSEAEKIRAGKDEDGNDILPDFLEFKTLDEAKRYAGRLNQRGQGTRFLPAEVTMGKTDLTGDIKRLLDAKNITSETSSPEINQLVKAFTGAESFGDMSLDDQKLFYARIRELPSLTKPGKIPVFKPRPFTSEQFVRAVKAENDAGRPLDATEIADVVGAEPGSPAVSAIRSELDRQNKGRETQARRQAEEVEPIRATLAKMLESFKIDPNILKVKTQLTDEEGRPVEGEGYFDPRLNELVVAIDAIDPEGIKTEEQRIQALQGVLTHEVLHVLRNLDLFTQKEFALLESAAARTKRKPKEGEQARDETYLQRAKRMYADKSAVIQVEEAIAELARDFIADKTIIGGKPRNLIERIIKFLTKLRNFMDGYGFTSFQDVLNAMQSGEIGGRERGQVRSLRRTEELRAKTLNVVPARYAPFIDQIGGTAGMAPEQPDKGTTATTGKRISDFDLAALEGADVRQSRKDVQSSKDWAYSPLMKAVESVSPKVTTAKQWDQWLDANAPKLGVTKDEIEFSGIKDFIALKEGKVSKDDVLAYLDQNGVQITETIFGESLAKSGELRPFTYRRSGDGTGWYIIDNNYPEQYPDGLFAGFIRGTEQDAIEEVRQANEDLVSGVNELSPFSPLKTKYQGNTLTGGKNYRELLLTLPKIHTSDPRILRMDELKGLPHTEENLAEYSRLAQETKGGRAGMEFRSSHWKEPNIVAHARIDTRTDANGEPVLFVNEIQSDWGQEGRKKGFAGIPVTGYQVMWEGRPIMTYDTKEEADAHVERAKRNDPSAPVSIKEVQTTKQLVNELSKGKVQRAPFVTDTKSWVALTIKRLLRYAVDNGLKKVAFINGEQAADLFDLSNQVSDIMYRKTDDDAYYIAVGGPSGGIHSGTHTASELEDYLGKELAQKVVNRAKPEVQELSGLDLKVGGEGMKAFYDRIVPQVATDVIRKIGGNKLSDIRVSIDESPGETAYEVVLPNGKVVKTTSSKRSAEATASSFDGSIVRVVTEMMGDQIGIEITPEMERNILAGQRLFSRKDVTSVQRGMASIGYNLVESGSPRQFKKYGTWEKDGVRVALSSHSLEAERGLVQKYLADGEAVTIEGLITDPDKRGTGLARKAMNDVIRFADQLGVTLYIEPVEIEKGSGMTKDVLSQFYSSLGFVPTDGSGLVMKRVPASGEQPAARNPNLVQRSPEVLQEAVQKVEKSVADTGKYAVPLYNPEASPEALYVALNPDFGQKLDSEQERRYSRRNAPKVSPAAKAIMDRATPLPPDETMGQTLIKKMEFPPIADMKDRFRQGAIFRYARLERQYRNNPELMAQLADTSAIAAIELADHARAFTQRAILYGVPAYENGTTKIKDFVHNGKQYRGLLEVMGMLYSREHGNLEQLAHAYATAVRGERLNKEGKLSPVAPGELAVLEKEVDRFVNPETGRPIIKEWFETWQAYNSNIVKYLRDTGIVDQAGADLWMKQADYIPFYREDADGNLQFPRVFGGLHTAGQFKAVGKSDKALNVDMVTAIVGNVDAAIAMGMKNVAQQRIIRDQIKLGLASVLKKGESVGQRNSVSFKVAGKRYTAIIEDPLIYESMLPVSEIPLDGIIGQAVRAPAGLLRELIIRDPGYMIANMFRDTLSSYAVTGAEIIPVVDTVRGMFSDLTNLENMGVVGGYDLRLDDGGVRKFYDKNAKKMGMVAGLDWTKPWSAVWEGMGRLSTRSEAATRLAVYNDVLARTGNEAEAQYQALSVMNYGRRGSNPLLRALTAVVPFMNARIQGLDKLYQAGRGRTGAKYDKSAQGEVTRNLNNLKNFQRFFFRAALITGVTALYYAMVSDDDEYKNASPEVRDGYYIIPLQKGDVAAGEPGLSMRLPIPFEVGILFKVIPERLLAASYGEDTPRDIQQSFWRNMTSTLAINPIPQAALPIVEMMFNYDTFTGRPVVPAYMENLLPEQQQTFYTNQLAVKLAESETGQKLGISPMKLEHLLNGYGGTLGGYFLQALDSVARENEMVKPDTTWYQKPFIKRFFTTANQPGLQNQFYDLKDYTDGITRTINDLEEQGRYDELAAFYAKNGHLYEMRSTLNFLNREITRLRDQRKMVEQMDIDPESKRELIEQINMQIAATLTTVPMLRQQAFGPRPETEE